MRRPGDLLALERAMLEELASEPGDTRAVSERTKQPYLAVSQTLARLLAGGHIEGKWDVAGERPRRVYTITARGRRAIDGEKGTAPRR